MRKTTQQLNITLPLGMAQAIREKVKTGMYANESEVICDGLRAFFNRDRDIEAWLNSEAVPAYDAFMDDPARAVTSEKVRARLASERKKSQ